VKDAVDRIAHHVEKLRDPKTKPGFRVMHWRIIIRIAQDEHDQQLEQLAALNAVHADPALNAAIGEPVV
jgi:hypothetical protein